MFHWCFEKSCWGGVLLYLLVVCRSCLGGVPVMFPWCFSHRFRRCFAVFRSCAGAVSLMFAQSCGHVPRVSRSWFAVSRSLVVSRYIYFGWASSFASLCVWTMWLHFNIFFWKVVFGIPDVINRCIIEQRTPKTCARSWRALCYWGLSVGLIVVLNHGWSNLLILVALIFKVKMLITIWQYFLKTFKSCTGLDVSNYKVHQSTTSSWSYYILLRHETWCYVISGFLCRILSTDWAY